MQVRHLHSFVSADYDSRDSVDHEYPETVSGEKEDGCGRGKGKGRLILISVLNGVF